MKVAVLMRGYSYREPGGIRPWGVDWRKTIKSHQRLLIDALRERYKRTDVYLVTYDSPYLGAVARDYNAISVTVVDKTNSQLDTTVEGLRSIPFGYDTVIVIRFDLELLLSPLTWGSGPKYDCVNFMFREWEEALWEDHRRVCDTIHILPGELLSKFTEGIENTTYERHWLHGIYLPVEEATSGQVHVMCDEYLCSNTDAKVNPLFHLVRVMPEPRPIRTATEKRAAAIVSNRRVPIDEKIRLAIARSNERLKNTSGALA